MKRLLLGLVAVTVLSSTAQAWWNKEWTVRKKVTIDTSAEGGAITEPIGSAAVLIRLYDGNYQFLNAKEDGSDIRFVSEDDKTVFPHHVEKYDGLLNEAFVWVKVPDLKPGAKASFWLYYGNPAAPKADDAKGSYEADTALVYHFAESGATAPSDSTGKGNNAQNPGVPAQGSLIGGGLRLDGNTAVTIPASSSLEWKEGAALTFSVWVKAAVLAPKAILFSRMEGESAFVVGLDQGVPFVEVSSAAGKQRSSGGEPLAVNVWRHLAVVAEGAKTTLYVDGESYGTASAGIPALKSASTLGKAEGADSGTEQSGFSGEIDELELANAARPVGALKLAAVSQSGSQKAAKLLQTGADEANSAGHSATLEHVMLFGDIARNMMFDGWIAVGVCVLMIICGWGVAIRKFAYLNSIQKGSDAFMEEWKNVSSDLTVLDHDDAESVKTLGGKVDGKTLDLMHRSPLYHLYHIGSEEIRHRVGKGKDRSRGLSARSIQAIRASLESGLVRENQRMHKGLVLLTISIAGGPYVGLLGTVVGVMITFAIIAKSGEVDVNSIAPGIASALLATVAGLIVAIPALFIYSYLSSRIKDLLAGMQVFIDEFIAKMAEFYPTPADMPASAVRSSNDPAQLPRVKEAQLATTSSNSHAS
ncbi:DUF2341 domain-containing protein [Verrucomicrobiota bacterium sgz303538]